MIICAFCSEKLSSDWEDSPGGNCFGGLPGPGRHDTTAICYECAEQVAQLNAQAEDRRLLRKAGGKLSLDASVLAALVIHANPDGEPDELYQRSLEILSEAEQQVRDELAGENHGG